MSQYVIIGSSPFSDVSVAVGPFRTQEKTAEVDAELIYRGWNTEVCELMCIADVEFVTNDEAQ